MNASDFRASRAVQPVTDGVASSVAVTLCVAPALEERIIDWLLARSDVVAITDHTVHAHGAHDEKLSVAEQVMGRRRLIELRVEMPTSSLGVWLADLGTGFAGADIRYSVSPILRSGHVRDLIASA
jgi:hypothetical protein